MEAAAESSRGGSIDAHAHTLIKSLNKKTIQIQISSTAAYHVQNITKKH